MAKAVNLLDLIKQGPQTPKPITPLKPKQVLTDIIRDIEPNTGQGALLPTPQEQPIPKTSLVDFLMKTDTKIKEGAKKEVPKILQEIPKKIKEKTPGIQAGLLTIPKFFTDWDIGKEMRDKLEEGRQGKEPSEAEKWFTKIAYTPGVNYLTDLVIKDFNRPEEDRASTKILVGQGLMNFGLKGILANPGAITGMTSFQTTLGAIDDATPLETMKFLQESREKLENYYSDKLQKTTGMNKGDAEGTARILTDAIDIILAGVGRGIGEKTIQKYGRPVGYTTEGAIQSGQDIAAGLLMGDEKLNTAFIVGSAGLTSPVGIKRPKQKTIDTTKVIPDDTQVKKTEAQVDKEVAEKLSPTETIKSTPELVKEYSEVKKTEPNLTFDEFKIRKEQQKTSVKQESELVKELKKKKKTPEVKDVNLIKAKKESKDLTKSLKNEVIKENKELMKSIGENDQIKARIKRLEQLGEKPLGKDEVLVYHGTDVNSAKKILETGKIEATESIQTGIREGVVDVSKRGDTYGGEGNVLIELRIKKSDLKMPKGTELGYIVGEVPIKNINKIYDGKFQDISRGETITPITKKETKALQKEYDTLSKKDSKDLTFEEGLRLGELKSKLQQEGIIVDNNLPDVSRVINKDISKSTDLTFELGIVQKLGQKIPYIGASTKVVGKLYIDIRNKLNNIQVINQTNGTLQGLADVLTGIGFRKNQIVNAGKKDFGINDLTMWSKNNSKDLRTTRNMLLKELDSIFTKEDGSIIQERVISAKSHLKEQYFDFLFKNTSLSDLRFISDVFHSAFIFNKKDISNLLPENIVKKLKDIDDNIRVRYDEEGNILNPNSKEAQMYEYFGDILIQEGFLKKRQLRKKMRRGVITREMFDYMKKNRPDLLKDMDIKTYEELIQMGYDVNLSDISEIPKYLSSILKSSENAMIYHSQDPITRMISYLDQMGQLKMNKEMVDTLNNARKADDAINKYIGDDVSGFLKTLLRLHDLTAFQKAASTTVGGLGAAAIIGNTKVASVSFLTTTARSIPVILRNITGVRMKSDVNKINDFLDKVGIESRFLETTNLGKVIGANYSLSSGGTYDRLSKGITGRIIMQRHLDNLKIKVEKGQNIVDVYERTLDTQSVEVQNKMLSDLGRQLLDIADYTAQSRGQIFGLNQRMFNVFKNFARTTVSRYLSYPIQTINDVYSGFKNQLPKGEIGDRIFQKTSFLISDTLVLYYAAKQLVDMLWEDEEDNEYTEQQKQVIADKLTGGGVVDKLGMLLGFWLQQPGVSMGIGTFNNITKVLYDIKENGLSTNQFDYARISGVIRTLHLLTKEKELTSGGLYKYSNEWSDSTIQNMLLFALGYSQGRVEYDVAKENIEKVQEEDKGLITQIIGKIIDDQNWIYSSIGETGDIVKYIVGDRDEKNDFYNFTIRNQSKKNIDAVLSNILDGNKTPLSIEDWITNAWDGFEIKHTEKDILDFGRANLISNKNHQQFLLKMVKELGVNQDPLYKGDMNDYMDKLKTKNPELFSQIIKKILNPVVIKIDGVRKTISDLEFTGQETGMSFVDEMLVERFEEYPRLVSDLSRRLERVIDKDPTDDELDSLNSVIKTMQHLPNLWDDVSSSIASSIGQKLKNVENIKEKLEDRPELYNIIIQALKLRGVKIIEPKTLKSNQELIGEIIKKTEKTPKTSGVQLPTGKLPIKESELVELLKLKEPKKQVSQPLMRVEDQGLDQNLIDILLRS